MKSTQFAVALCAVLLAGALLRCAHAGQVQERNAVIMSEGPRVHAVIYVPESTPPLPTIIISQGWGGTAALLRAQAMDIAQAGYLVLDLDYRGWDRSDGRLIRGGAAPAGNGADSSTNPDIMELREVVDPLDQAMDMQNVIHWAMGEPAVDKTQLGLWGTSFSGGLVIYVAARDARVRW